MKHTRRYGAFYKCFGAAVITEAVLLYGLYLFKDKQMPIQWCVYASILAYNFAIAHFVNTRWRIQRMRKHYRQVTRENHERLYSRYPHLKPESQLESNCETTEINVLTQDSSLW